MGPREDRRDRADGAVQLPAGDELCEDVDTLCGLKGLDQRHDEGMVGLPEQITLPFDLLGNLAVLLHHALQGVPHRRLLVLHEAHNARSASSNDLDGFEVFESDTGVLQPDAVHQLLLHVALDNLRKRRLFHRPELRLVAKNLDCRRPWLIEEEGSLSEVHVLAKLSHLGAIDLHGHLSTGYDEEGGAHLILLDDGRPLSIPLQHE
mmetsp:Transcript_69377/g.224319  ORF Transcript_69377/g.224319 Transcript_69377/m.224319 type:complete len:206 (+) Transcript_69377:692-1309(+)